MTLPALRVLTLLTALLILGCGPEVREGKTVPARLVGDWCHLADSGFGPDIIRLNPDSIATFWHGSSYHPDEPLVSVTVLIERGTSAPRALYLTSLREDGNKLRLTLDLERPQQDDLPVTATASGTHIDYDGGTARYVRVPRGSCEAKY